MFLIEQQGTMLYKQIKSKFLKENLLLKIYKPKSYSPLYKYNICVMLDGDDYYKLGQITSISDQLHDKHQIENTIFVGIHYNNIRDRRMKYHPQGEKRMEFMRFLAHEVIPFLDQKFSTFMMTHTRALIGESLAGTSALMTVLKYPHTIGKVIMQSPYVDQTVLQTVADYQPIKSIDLYHSIGTNETAVQITNGLIVDFVEPNQQLSKLFKKSGTSYQYKEFKNEKHTWKYWQQHIPNALTSMFPKITP